MDLSNFYKTDIGINANVLYEVSSKYKNSIFVDLGVREGVSSEILMIDAKEKNNTVYGVDVDFKFLNKNLQNNTNYKIIKSDSVTLGKNWKDEIDGLFVDTFHIKEQVLCELYYWYDYVKPGGFIAFHDTNWPKDKNDKYGGIIWDRVEYALYEFFDIEELYYEDDFIKVTNHPESWGMTLIEIKKKKDYKSTISDWSDIFNKRNKLISLFWNESNSKDIQIELEINV